MIKNQAVAIKKIEKAFYTVASAQYVYREIHYLTAMDHPNIVKVKGMYYEEPEESDQPADSCNIDKL